MAVSNQQIINSAVMFLAVGAAVFIGTNPLLAWIRQREREYGSILQRSLLLEFSPRLVSVLTGATMLLLGGAGYALLRGSLIALFAGWTVGLLMPGWLIRYLKAKRLRKLEQQLVSGVQTLASGVRAGLNLIQSMQLIARDAPRPLRQEFAHLIREYDYGVPLDQAMDNAAQRIGSGDYRLLFHALHTHRQRGGDLGETLDRIAKSIREIQRLENKVRTETARGRATARWLGALPLAVLGVLYLIVPEDMIHLFTTDIGKWILAAVILFNLVGYLWIRKIMAIDI
jgi:tight adherence protein B